MEQKLKERIALSTLFFASGLCFSTWAARIPDIKEAFKLSDSELGVLLLIKPIGSLLALPLAGFIVDKYGPRFASFSGIVGFSFSLVLLGIATTSVALACGILLFGIFSNLVNISNNTQSVLIQQKFDKMIISSFHGLWSLASFLGGAIGALMLSIHVSTSTHFFIIACVLVVMMLLSIKYISPKSNMESGKKFALVKPDKELFMLGTIALCGMLCEGCMVDWSGVYFKQVIKVDESLVAIGFTSYMATMALGRFASDFFTNRFGIDRIIQTSGILIFSGLLISVILPYFETAVLGFFLVGAGTASVIPLTFAQVGKTKQYSPGIALAIVSTIGYIGFLSGPPLIGFIADLLSLRASFLLVALVGLTITLLKTKIVKREVVVENL